MSSQHNQTSDQTSSTQRTSPSNDFTTAFINSNAKSNTSNKPHRQHKQQPGSEYWTSSNTSSDTSSQQPSTMSSTTSSRSPASSTRGSGSIDSLKRPLITDQRKSPIDRAMDKAKSKLGRSPPSGAEALPNDELDYERQRVKAVEKQRKKEEYERLGLNKQTKYGMPGGVSFGG